MNLRPTSNEDRGVFLAEWRSLEAERDPELRAEGLYHLARRAEARENYAAAAELYRRLEGTPLAARAAERRSVLEGGGGVGARAEFLLRHFAREATDPSMLFAMGSAGALFKATRFFTLARMTAAPASLWTRGWGARTAASLAAFAVEAPAFPLAGRLARTALGQSQDWGAAALRRDLASSVLVLGGLKLGGAVSSAVARHLSGAARSSALVQGLFRQSGMFGGILLGHRFEEMAGLRAPTSTAATWVDSLAMLLQFQVAGRLTQAAFGAGFQRWENGIELQTRRLEAQARPWGGESHRPIFPFFLPMAAMSGWGGGGRRIGGEMLGPQTLRTRGSGRGTRAPGLPAALRISLLQLRNANSKLAEAHLTHLESVLAQGGRGLAAKDFLELYHMLRMDLEVIPNEGLSLKLGEVLTNVLSEMPLHLPGPSLLFRDMTQVDRLAQVSLGEFLDAWMRNPNLESTHRRRILGVVESVFRREVVGLYEESLETLSSHLHRLSGEGRAFHRVMDAVLACFNGRNAGFHRIGGAELARAALLDSQTRLRHQDHFLALLRNGWRDGDLTSDLRVEAMKAMEAVFHHPNLPRSRREELEDLLPLWREEFLYDNVVRTRRGRGEWAHFAEMAYLLAQEYTPAAERRNFSRALRRSIFDARFGSPGYKLMVHDARRYLENPRLAPESRQTFLLQLLKAAGDLNELILEQVGDLGGPPNEIVTVDLRVSREIDQLQNLLTILHELPREESLGLGFHLAEELNHADGRAWRASILLQTLSGLVYPTPNLLERLSQAAERTTDPQIRGAVREVLEYWQSLN